MNTLNISVNAFDVQCKYPDIFNEHMKTHTGEKPLTSKVCDLVIEARSINNDHNSLTKIVKYLSVLNVKLFARLKITY